MYRFFFLMLVVISSFLGCASPSSDETERDTIYGSWVYANYDGSSGVGLTLNRDGTYIFVGLAMISPTSFFGEVETGNFSEANSKLTFNPTASTCPNTSAPATSI